MNKRNLDALLKLAVYMEQDENVAKLVHTIARNVETVKTTGVNEDFTYRVKANITGVVGDEPVRSNGIDICITKTGY